MQVLLIDDTPVSLTFMKYLVQKIPGGEVVSFADPLAGLEWCRGNEPDLLIVDFMMPQLDGIATCRLLREQPRLKDTYVMVLTARSEEFSEVAAFEAGASAYLLKRCVGEELGQAIRAVRSGNFYVTPLVTKDVVAAGSTTWAQGGIASVQAEGDTVAEHVTDTLVAGAGL